MIKDSGQRREFSTGVVRDIQEGKGRYDLLPWEAIHELALHCEQGAIKYGERNCEKGIPIHSLIDSAIRHLSCYLRGMKDEPHPQTGKPWGGSKWVLLLERITEFEEAECVNYA